MVSMEFIRNATVASDRVAAMTAEGISQRLSGASPTAVDDHLAGRLFGSCARPDQRGRPDFAALDRHPLDEQSPVQRLKGNQVKYVYYIILSMYGILGFTMLCLFPALSIAKFAGGVANIALAICSMQALFANRILLPKPLRPHWLLQTGVVCCAMFFLGISGVVLYDLLR